MIYDQGITGDATVAVSYWASRLAWQLRYEGFDQVAVLDGGFVKWLEETFVKAGVLDPNKKVIVYCGFAVAATWVALLLKKCGQKNVAVYDGSLEEWASDLSLPLEINEII